MRQQLKLFIDEQRNFLIALCISVLFNLGVTIEHENQIVEMAVRLLFIIAIALVIEGVRSRLANSYK